MGHLVNRVALCEIDQTNLCDGLFVCRTSAWRPQSEKEDEVKSEFELRRKNVC